MDGFVYRTLPNLGAGLRCNYALTIASPGLLIFDKSDPLKISGIAALTTHMAMYQRGPHALKHRLYSKGTSDAAGRCMVFRISWLQM